MNVMKRFTILFLVFIVSFWSFGLVACDNKSQTENTPKCEHVWDDGIITTKATKGAKGVITYSCALCEEKKEENYILQAPTATEICLARQKVIDETVEGYDFNFSLGANLSMLGLGTSVEGSYAGKYRKNKTINSETLYRETSGALFFDSSTYSFTLGDSKIRMDCDKNKNPEKISIMANDDDGFFVNRTVVSLVDSIQESYINNIEIDDISTPYDFVAELNLGANIPILSKLTNILSCFGTKIAFKNISFVNPAAIPIHFNIDENGRLNDFEVELNFEISIKLSTVTVFFKYEQNDSNSTIQIPNINGLSVDSTQINNDIEKINQAINTVKNSDTYSLDAMAENEFDPAWNKLAIVDRYTSRLYKNKVEDNIWFNHSYEFKSHHEEEGAEKYSYTIGNITDGSTYKVARKGVNKTSTIENVSADTQFNYLVNPFILNASSVDCISSTIMDDVMVYKVHLNNLAATSIQDRVLDIVNSNDAAGVVDIDNYMNSQITIKKAVFIVTIKNGRLESILIETDLKYNPTSGEYTDYNISLTNTLELKINKNLEKAQSYIAPEKSEGNVFQIDSLDNAKFYIL